jgi:hypothetical protein
MHAERQVGARLFGRLVMSFSVPTVMDVGGVMADMVRIFIQATLY